MNWFESQRMDWIFEMLQIYGFINRKHLIKKFRISRPQAAADLQKAKGFYPSMEYDLSRKCYVWKEK